MSEFTAAPQQEYPESTMSLDDVVAGMIETEHRFIRLYKRYNELNGVLTGEDKRKTFNPIRDLKISASRAYQWARRAGCNADEAHERAIVATIESSKLKFPGTIFNADVAENTFLPGPVIAYIDQLYAEYNLNEGQKKARRKANAKFEKNQK